MKAMLPQTAHNEVINIIDQVRCELLSASPHRAGDAARVARALNQAFEILALNRCERSSSSWDESNSEQHTNDTCMNSHGSFETGNKHLQGDEEQADRVRQRRSFFLESLYLPFASFLLRDVGPSWLPVWDAGGAATRQSSAVAAASVSRPHSPRGVFEAFFRPPAVPASLALLALCEALSSKGKQEVSLDGQQLIPPRSELDSAGDGKVPAGAEVVTSTSTAAAADSGTAVGMATPGPRTSHVQYVCNLLEPYLDDNSGGLHLLALAVAELAQSTDADLIRVGECTVKAAEGEKGREGERKGPRYYRDERLPPLRGGDAAEALASALCLAPHRVANGMGTVAPPAFAPAAFYPALCRAALRATMRCFGNGNTERSSAAPRRDAGTGAIASDGFADDVWRAFSGRLLSAGRASDLADAWLRAMAEEFVGTGRGGGVDQRTGDDEEEEAAAWEEWAADSVGSKIHSRMIARLPASWRKPFTEALLRALWQKNSRERRRLQSYSYGRERSRASPEEKVWPKGFPAVVCRVLIGLPLLSFVQSMATDQIQEDGRVNLDAAAVMNQQREQNSEVKGDVSVGMVEELVLQRPLPSPAAEAIADTLAWCDRRQIAQMTTWKEGGSGGEYGGEDSNQGKRTGQLLIGALERVAAVWAEPSFLNHSPPRQQNFQTRFLLAALRGGGTGGVDLLSKDHEVLLPLLIRGVGARLDVATRETRLQGMRVGEAVAALSGQELRFAELDDERREAEENPSRSRRRGQAQGVNPGKPGGGVDVAATASAAAAFVPGEKPEPGSRSRARRSSGVGKQGAAAVPLASNGAGQAVEVSIMRDDGDKRREHPRSDEEKTDYSAEDDGDDLDDGDGLDAYDMWDEEEDLAAVAEPIYLDQLIELLRSRDEPETAHKHETALRCAETLVRRRPPDLPHRAAELSRDLLYMENAFDLEGFHKIRAKAMLATVAAAPETCALYLGSEVWGTGASEGTKIEILDILVQAASELAGWTIGKPDNASGGVNSDGGASRRGGCYPSALMREARGTTHRSARLQQQQQEQHQRRRSSSPDILRLAEADVSDRPAAAGAAEGGAVVSTGDPRGFGNGEFVARRTRRWGYRRGPRKQLRRNLFGRVAPMFFYPLAQGMIVRLRQAIEVPPPEEQPRRLPLGLGSIVSRTPAVDVERDGSSCFSGSDASLELWQQRQQQQQQPPPSPLFSARLLHALTCLVELCGSCPATPSLAVDLLGLAWLLRGPAAKSRELRRAVLIAVVTGVERSPEGVASGVLHGHAGELLRWLQECAVGADEESRELAAAVLGHSSVQALAYL